MTHARRRVPLRRPGRARRGLRRLADTGGDPEALGPLHPPPAPDGRGHRAGEGRPDVHGAAVRAGDGERVRLVPPAVERGDEDDEGLVVLRAHGGAAGVSRRQRGSPGTPARPGATTSRAGRSGSRRSPSGSACWCCSGTSIGASWGSPAAARTPSSWRTWLPRRPPDRTRETPASCGLSRFGRRRRRAQTPPSAPAAPLHPSMELPQVHPEAGRPRAPRFLASCT